MFEEPEKMQRIVREDVRKGTNVLAKAKSEAPAPKNEHLGVIMY
jgi:hypothetical protein